MSNPKNYKTNSTGKLHQRSTTRLLQKRISFSLCSLLLFSSSLWGESYIVSGAGTDAVNGTYDYYEDYSYSGKPAYRMESAIPQNGYYYLYCGNLWKLDPTYANISSGTVQYYCTWVPPADGSIWDGGWSNSGCQGANPVPSFTRVESPRVATSAVANVTSSSADLGGDVIAQYGSAVTERGIVYSTSDNTPRIGEAGVTKAANGAGLGTYTEALDNLDPNTTYYMRAYAINTQGTSYGVVRSFTTLKNSQTIDFDVLPEKTFGDANFDLNATASSTLNVTYTSSNTSVATISGSTVTIIGAGATTITASQAGNSTYYAANDVQQTLTVNKATPSITTWPTASAITYGDPLSSSTLSGQVVVTAGTFAFTTPGSTPDAGTANYSVTFTPTDGTNYSTVTSNVSVTINKATPSITTWPTASAITYGDALSSSTLSGQVVITAGTFAFTTPGTTPNAGTANHSVTFTPTDGDNYSIVTSNVSVIVNKATPSITTWPTASAITYGDALSSSTLSGQVFVTTGTFAFTTPGTTPNVGTANYSVTFTPTDSTNYSKVTSNISVTVNKATPSITTWPTASAITYGDALSSSILSGQVVVTAGTFAFTTPGTIPNAGTANYSVTFTPTDGNNYTTATNNVSVTVYRLPAVTTQAATSIGTTTATGNGNITILGVPGPTQYGHVWSTSGTPTTSNSKTELGIASVNGAFTSSLTALTASTQYYIRAYATNALGTVYGDLVTFTTFAPAPTAQPTNLRLRTLTASGNNSIVLAFTPTASAERYLVVRKSGSVPAFVPSNGTVYASGSTQGDAYVVYSGTDTGATDANLGDATYYYSIYAYRSDGASASYLINNPSTGTLALSSSGSATLSNQSGAPVSAGFPNQGVEINFPNGSNGTDLTVTRTNGDPGASFGVYPNVRGVQNLYFSITSTNSSPGNYNIILDFSSLNLTPDSRWNNFKVLKRSGSPAVWKDISEYGGSIVSRATDGVYGKFTISGLSSFSQFAVGEENTTHTVTSANESGTGSLKAIIEQAENGDAITFDTVQMGSKTITLTSPLTITKDLSISSPSSGIVLNGNNTCRVLTIGTSDGVANTPRVRISNTIIKYGNDTENIAGGIVNYGNLQLVNCQITNNSDPGIADGYGAVGGIYSTGDLTIVNSSVAYNTGAASDGGIGGIYCEGTLSIYNSIIYGNQGEENNFSGSQLVTVFKNSLLEDNIGTLMSTTGSLVSSNPQFVDASQEIYHLSAASPCLDAGSNDYMFESKDLYGSARIQNTTVDMGPYEGEKALPTVSTSTTTSITTTSATLGGTVSADGGTSVSARGIVYSATLRLPVIGETGVTEVAIGNGMGAFSKSINSLTAGMKYYFRAYATNLFGTAYGVVDSLTCNKQPQTILFIDTIKTYGISDFSPASATSGLTVVYSSSDTNIASIVSGLIHIRKAGSCTITATQNGNATYLAADTVRRTLQVNKAVPIITTWPTASSIIYGQILASSSMSGEVTVTSGVFSFSDSMNAPSAGTSSHSIIFTPTDTANYTTATQTVSVTVGKATPTISTWPSASVISYGQTLANSTLSGQVIVTAGIFSFTAPTNAPLAGISSHPVIFIPTDTANYTTVTQHVNVTISKAIPTVTTWPTAAAIDKGQTLANATLSGEAVVTSGTFAFTDPTITPPKGTSNYPVIFTPTDIANYTTITQNVSVIVGKAIPTIAAWPSATAISYGQTLANSTLSGAEKVTAGTFAFTDPTIAPSVGVSSHMVTFTPSDTANYATVTQNVSVSVKKASPAVTAWPIASAISYGQTLSLSVLSGGVVVTPGIFTFTSPAGVPGAGTADQPVIFTPADTVNYTTAAHKVSITVNPKALTINGLSGVNKTYNGTNAATLSGSAVLSGLVKSDSGNVIISGIPVATFANAGVDTAITISVTGYTLSGSAAGNYTLNQPTGLTAAITPKLLKVTGLTATSKIYDGTKNVSLFHGTLSGVVGKDTVSINTVTAAFNDSSIGADKPITVTSIVLSGSQATNYTVELPTGLTGSILIPPPSTAPVISTVFNDTMGTIIPLNWDTVSNATGYRIVVGYDSSFVARAFDTTINSSIELFVNNLVPDTTLWLRITAVNSSGNGPWSDGLKFRTLKKADNVENVSKVVVKDTVTRIIPAITISTGTNTTVLGNKTLSVVVKKDTIIDTGTTQVSTLYDFSGSSISQLSDSINLTFTISDTFPDGTSISPAELADVRVYEIDTLGAMTAIFNAIIDTSARKISYETDHLGVNVLAIDRVSPSIGDNTEHIPKTSGDAPVIVGQIVDNISNCRVYVHFRTGGAYAYDSLPVTIGADGSFSLAVDNSALDLNGFEYYISAYDGTNRVTVNRQDIPVKVISVSDNTPLPSMQWRLFSVPVNLSASDIAGFFDQAGVYGKDWKLYQRSLSNVADSFVEYGPNLSSLNTGISYWIKSYNNSIGLGADSGVTTPVSRCYEIKLPPKTWAAVGNPYLFTVGWSNIVDSTGTSSSKLIGPYTYEDSAWIPPSHIDKLTPWRGYYVYNSGDSALTMRIPSLSYRPNSVPAKRRQNVIGGTFEWVVSSKTGRDRYNYFGIVADAGSGYDAATDFPKAGSPEKDVPVTWFCRPGFAKIASRFQTDFTSLEDGGAVWQSIVGNISEGKLYKCAIEGLASLPDSLKCILIDKHAGITHDMDEGAYSFIPLKKEMQREMEIVIGTQAYVANYKKNMHLPPQRLALNASFLRSGMLTIRYEIPWNVQPVPVRIDLFDIQGRLIATLINEHRNCGYFTVNLDSRKTALASGLLIVRLKAGNNRLVTKSQILR